MAANDDIADLFTRHAIDLQRVDAGQRRAIRRILKDLEGDIVAQLARIDPTGVTRQSARQGRLEKLLDQVRDTVRASYRSASATLRGELRELADIEATFAARAINQGVGFGLATTEITRSQATALVSGVLVQGSPVGEWWQRQAGDTLQRFTDEMRRGIAEGETNAQLIRRVRGGKQNGEPVQGFMEITRRNAESLVRSATQATAQAAREITYDQNADILKGIMWAATLDSRTTVGCAARDGLLYSVGDHKPIDHDLPWESGPGNRHWGALAEGSLIRTQSGLTPIERVREGDRVITHDGTWSTVTATMRKRAQHGVMRVAHMKSGRVLRATYDHPVWTVRSGWVFMGRLQVGDKMRSDAYGMEEIIGASRLVVSEPENGPAALDQGQIAIKRTIQFVAAKIGFKCSENVGPREIEDRAISMVLADPVGVYDDQSALHHHFALAHVLGQVGLYRLSAVLTLLRGFGATVDLADAIIEAVSLIGRNNASKYFGVLCRVFQSHALRVPCIIGMGLFGMPKGPMAIAGRVNDASGINIEPRLLFLGADGDGMPLGVGPQRAVGQSFFPLDAAERKPVPDVSGFDKVSKARVSLGHDEVLSIGVQIETPYVYDLEVQGNSSYFANGVAVSNCRSTSTPVTKSFRELGIDADEVPPGTRASMNGQVPQDTTFDGWLQRQPKSVQADVLGQGRAELWRENKLSFRDLLDGNGRELSLQELRARI